MISARHYGPVLKISFALVRSFQIFSVPPAWLLTGRGKGSAKSLLMVIPLCLLLFKAINSDPGRREAPLTIETAHPLRNRVRRFLWPSLLNRASTPRIMRSASWGFCYARRRSDRKLRCFWLPSSTEARRANPLCLKVFFNFGKRTPRPHSGRGWSYLFPPLNHKGCDHHWASFIF